MNKNKRNLCFLSLAGWWQNSVLHKIERKKKIKLLGKLQLCMVSGSKKDCIHKLLYSNLNSTLFKCNKSDVAWFITERTLLHEWSYSSENALKNSKSDIIWMSCFIFFILSNMLNVCFSDPFNQKTFGDSFVHSLSLAYPHTYASTRNSMWIGRLCTIFISTKIFPCLSFIHFGFSFIRVHFFLLLADHNLNFCGFLFVQYAWMNEWTNVLQNVFSFFLLFISFYSLTNASKHFVVTMSQVFMMTPWSTCA